MTLSTHVLDLTQGLPARGVVIVLESGAAAIFTGVTNADGRCPDLASLDIACGVYRFSFAIGAYFRGLGILPQGGGFFDRVVIEISVADASAHYHVPLLVSPFGYSTYRGS